jgi:hypothetical protein
MKSNKMNAKTAGASLSKGYAVSLKYLSIFSAGLLLFACANASREDRVAASEANLMKTVADSVSSYTKGIATDTINGITHNFIREAKVKCKVTDVLKASQKIEDVVAAYGGYVTSSNLTSNINYSNSLLITEDSLKETTYYTTEDFISVRVPNKSLDSIVRTVVNLATFVDYQTTSADDVKLKLYANQLAERRLNKHTQLAQKKVNNSSSNISKINAVENDILDKEELADNKRLESVELIDQVNYSTVKINLYQDQTEKSRVILKPLVTEPYQPSFVQKLGKAIESGFGVLKAFILFIAEGWSIWLILIGLAFGIHKTIKYFSNKAKVGEAV